MRSTKLEVRQRTEAVAELLAHGARFRDVREYAVKNEWNLSDSQLRKYQTKALEIIEKRTSKDRGKMLALTLMRRELLYARAVEAADYGTALRIDQDRAQLYRLYDVPSPPPADGPTPTPAEVQGIIARQLAQVERSDLPAADKARTTAALCDGLLKAWNATELEKQVAELAARLDKLKPEKGTKR